MTLSYDILPEYMRQGAQLYVEKGIEPGGFLYAVLTNNFKDVIQRADITNIQCLKEWAQWVIWNCPAQAQGNETRVDYWIKTGGLEGQKRLKFTS